MTIKYFDGKMIMIKYDKNTICIRDEFNNFSFTLDVKMKKYFVPSIERLHKICYEFRKLNIPTHKHIEKLVEYEILCNEILNCYRKYGVFEGNYMDINRKSKIISAFKECFKRVKEEDIELLDLDLKSFSLKSLLYIKRGLL